MARTNRGVNISRRIHARSTEYEADVAENARSTRLLDREGQAVGRGAAAAVGGDVHDHEEEAQGLSPSSTLVGPPRPPRQRRRHPQVQVPLLQRGGIPTSDPQPQGPRSLSRPTSSTSASPRTAPPATPPPPSLLVPGPRQQPRHQHR